MTSRKGIQRFALACIVISTGLAVDGSVSGISTGATLQAGAGYTITVTDAPNSPVTISWNKNGSSYGTPNYYAGNTDGSGVFTLSGTIQVGDIGDWYEYYYVNGASTGTLQFMVRQTPASGACSSIPWGQACIHGNTSGANYSGGAFYGIAELCSSSDPSCGSPLSTISYLHDLGGGNLADFQFVNTSDAFYVHMLVPPGFGSNNPYTWDSPNTDYVAEAPGYIYTLNFHATCTAYGHSVGWPTC
jgi:hypothetical protein